MANLALKILYNMWNTQYNDVYVERIFLPEDTWESPQSIETGSYLKSFDVLAVTIQFELDYINFIRMLLQSEIPIYRKDRNSNSDPIVIAGGPAVTANPLILSDFVDLIIQGEVEPLSDKLISHLYDRSLAGLQPLGGIYLPDHPPSTARYSRITNFDNGYIPIDQVRNVNDANWKESQVLGGYLLQVSRGCNRGCKFCLIGRLTQPMRERSLNTLKQTSIRGTSATQVNRITLIGSGVGDYSELTKYLNFLNQQNIKFSIPSIRADSDPQVIQEIVNSGQKSITIAPESGSDEYRYQIGKRISNDQFFQYTATAHEFGIRKIKLYFILGLPNQNMQEIDNIIAFCQKISPWFKKRNLNLTMGYFIPKRQTIFHDFEINKDHFILMQKMEQKIKQELKNSAFLSISPIKWGIIQTILSIGDDRLSPFLEKIAQTEGKYQDWVKILKGDPLSFLIDLQNQENLTIPLVLN